MKSICVLVGRTVGAEVRICFGILGRRLKILDIAPCSKTQNNNNRHFCLNYMEFWNLLNLLLSIHDSWNYNFYFALYPRIQYRCFLGTKMVPCFINNNLKSSIFSRARQDSKSQESSKGSGSRGSRFELLLIIVVIFQ